MSMEVHNRFWQTGPGAKVYTQVHLKVHLERHFATEYSKKT